jgi:3-deoxy-7-phosphoheptulonate synthase
VEFFRGLENPVGIKVSKDFAASDEELSNLIKIIKVLNPENKVGKIVLITRLGARNVEAILPKIISAIKNEGTTL